MSRKIKNAALIILILLGMLFMMRTSPIYPWTNNTDTQTYITVARCMNAGKTLYKDIADQKGPLWFLFMMLLDKIPIKTTITIWITEIIAICLFSILQYKLIDTRLKDKQKSQTCALLATLLYTFSFPLYYVGGVCIEEYNMILLSAQIYIVVKNENNEMRKIDYILLGITSSAMFLTKYTSLIPTIVLAATVIIRYIKTKKKIKTYVTAIIYFIIGLIPLILLCFIYLLKNEALTDCIQVYFHDNIVSYKLHIDTRIAACLMIGAFTISTMVAPMMFTPPKKGKLKGTMIIQTMVSLLLIFLSGAGFMTYYMVLYAFLGLNIFIISNLRRRNKILTLIVFAIPIIIAMASCTYYTNYDKVAQTEAAEIIKQYDDQSINTILAIDTGIYYALDTIPEYKYPYCLESGTNENIQSQINCVKNKETNFLVSNKNLENFSKNRKPRKEWFYGIDMSGYKLIYTAEIRNGYNTTLYLYKRID